MKISAFRHEFIEQLPDRLSPGVLYASIPCKCLAHLCACGCGSLVITPLSPSDWKMTFDGKTISLSPSIGNWSFPCRSHYWIREGQVEWAKAWNDSQIAQNRAADIAVKQRQYAESATPAQQTLQHASPAAVPLPSSKTKRKGWWSRLFGG